MDERTIIARLQEIFATTADPDLLVGIGDDAALIRIGETNGGLVIATDLLTEGTHFNREWSDPYSIGRKAAAANLADIFAMGIPPRYLLVAVALRPEDEGDIFDLARGIADESLSVGARVIGGDLSRSEALTVSITALGRTTSQDSTEVVTRKGAKPGDGLFILADRLGLPGRSLLGLEQLQRGIHVDLDSLKFHRAPQVPYQSFLSVAKVATSLCDISDGIMFDATALAAASGVTIDIDSVAIHSHPHFDLIEAVAKELGLDPVLVALTSGEEHSPLFTVDAGTLIPDAWQIGRVIPRGDSLLMQDGSGIEAVGFSHF